MDSFLGNSAAGRNPDECFRFPISKLWESEFENCIYIETAINDTFGIVMIKRAEDCIIVTFKPLNETLDVSRHAGYLSAFDGKVRNTVTSAMLAVAMIVKNKCADISEYRTFIHNCCKLLRLSGTTTMLAIENDTEAGFSLKTAELCRLLDSICRKISPPLNTLGIAIGLHTDKTHLISSVCEDWIERAVLNLISCAISRMKGGGRIRIILEEAENQIIISVCDTGEPIQYYSKPRDDTNYSSRDIVRRIVKAHGGSLITSYQNSENRVAMMFPIVASTEPFLTISTEEIVSFVPYEYIELSDALSSELYDFADNPEKHNRKADN